MNFLNVGGAMATADGPDIFKIMNVTVGQTVAIRARPAGDGAMIAKIPGNTDGIISFGCIGGLSISDWQLATVAQRKNAAQTRWCRIGFGNAIGWVHGPVLAEGTRATTFAGGRRLSKLSGSDWTLRDFAGDRTELDTWISFQDGGRAVGFGGCNRFNGTFEERPGVITFGPIASTHMACPDPIEKAEQKLYGVLERTAYHAASEGLLALFSGNNELLATFSRRQTK